VDEDAATVVSRVFDEAERCDPGHRRTWAALVDGNDHQIERIQAEAHARQVDVTVVVDFVHVLEYLWKAAWCFFDEGDPDAERWVRDLALAVLKGHADGLPPPSDVRQQWRLPAVLALPPRPRARARPPFPPCL